MTMYYVDATLGDDAHPGTIGEPWQTVAKVNGFPFVAGDDIYFKMGEIWYESIVVARSGVSGSVITYGAYGEGNRPLFMSGTNQFTCYGYDYIVVDDLEFAYASTYGMRIYYSSDHVTIKNCYSHHNGYGILIYNASYNLLESNEVSYNNVEGIRVYCDNATRLPYSNEIRYNHCHHNLRYGILFTTTYSFPINGATSPVHHNECNNNSAGIYLVYTDNVEMSYNDVHDNGYDCKGTGTCIGEAYGIAVQSGQGNNIHHNAMDGNYTTSLGIYGSQVATERQADNNEIHHNIVTHTKKITSQKDMEWQCWGGNSVGSNNKVYYNIFSSDGNGQNFVIDDDADGVTSGNEFNNNICYGGTVGIEFIANSSNLGWSFKNNIFANNSDYSIDAFEISGGMTLGHNVYYKPGGGTLVRYNSGTYTSANIDILDSDAIISNPQFVDPLKDNFHIKPTSPCINAGEDVGLTEDYDGNPIIRNPDIGAYEFERFYGSLLWIT